MKKILFVCTGNTCRSPMAEALFNKYTAGALDWTADSAGVFAAPGTPASTNAVRAVEELGADLSTHQSKPLTRELVEAADLIVAMTRGHLREILFNHPEVEPKVCLLKSFGTSKVPADISDPFGGSLGLYREIRDEINGAVADLILFIREEYT